MKISRRLLAVASMVTPGTVVADIGTDHGYVPIYLVGEGICPKAYACDVNMGPLEKANEHIVEEKLESKIHLLLSNGMVKLEDDDIDSVVIAGMGGELICKIIEESPILCQLKELIVSPHHDVDRVRNILLKKGFDICEEKMIMENDKYYNIIKAIRSDEIKEYDDFQLKYSKKMFETKDEVFFEYLNHMMNKYNIILSRLENSNDINRKKELLSSMEECKRAIELFDV